MKEYPYAAENRLQTPHSYMYTPFEGSDFFASYSESRIKCLYHIVSQFSGKKVSVPALAVEFFNQGLVGLENCSGSFKPASELVEGLQFVCEALLKAEAKDAVLPSDKDHFISESVFEVLFELASTPGDNEFYQWLEWFTHRFEVAKCIRIEYNVGDGKHGEKSTDLIHYGLLASLLAISVFRSGDYKHLNVLLKVNDLMCSVIEEDWQEELLVLPCLAIILELVVIHNACQQEEVV